MGNYTGGMELIGWASALCFGLCALPQTLKSVRTGRAEDLAWGFLVLWLIGEFLGFAYVLPKRHLPILANYVLNVAFVIPIVVVKLRGGAR